MNEQKETPDSVKIGGLSVTTGSAPLPWPTPMARRANWDKRYRMRLNIGRIGEKESVTITWEGNDASAVRSMANTFVAAYNAALPNDVVSQPGQNLPPSSTPRENP